MNDNRPAIPIAVRREVLFEPRHHCAVCCNPLPLEQAGQAESMHRGDRNAAYILKRLKPKEIRRCQQFTEDDEEFIGKVIRLVEEASLPKRTAKELAAKLKDEIQPLKVLAILRHDIKRELFQTSPASHASQALAPREVILSSWLTAEHQI